MLPSQLKHLTGWPIGSRFAEVDRGDEYVFFSFAETTKGLDAEMNLSIETEIVIQAVFYKDRSMKDVYYASIYKNVEDIINWPDIKFPETLFNKRLEGAAKCLTLITSLTKKSEKKSLRILRVY